ncbi:cysteine proteinase COT44 [Artemisia annua]|uniref:Cysteine proteinase COT44 n=1 Tax=Artemisia annua TaxID=35608 RepID=A0A2U1LWC7_ARTAN|nr:cysteine proteinase COT44 [Artemisia annua]
MTQKPISTNTENKKTLTHTCHPFGVVEHEYHLDRLFLFSLGSLTLLALWLGSSPLAAKHGGVSCSLIIILNPLLNPANVPFFQTHEGCRPNTLYTFQFLRVWRMTNGDVDEDEDVRNDKIDYKRPIFSFCILIRMKMVDFITLCRTMGDRLDWCERGVVAPTRSLNGAFVAFATIASIESIHHIAHNSILENKFSTQYIIDCYNAYESKDAVYGHVRRALRYILNHNQGYLYSEHDYPPRFKDMRGVCASAGLNPCTRIHGLGRVRANESQLLEVVKKQPVAASIASSRIALYPLDARNFVLIIGYGTEGGVDYWLCQNFWRYSYREDGYFRVERNVCDPRGTAGVARKCFFPVIEGHGASDINGGADIEKLKNHMKHFHVRDFSWYYYSTGVWVRVYDSVKDRGKK